MSDVERWLQRHAKVKSQKSTWNILWQYCGEYIHTKKVDFTEINYDGQFLHRDLYDSTAPKANRRMAASLLGLLWLGAKRSVRIKPVRELEGRGGVKDYFDYITNQVTTAMDDPKAGLTLALEEYMNDQGAFGTSGIGVFDGEDLSDLTFSAWGIDEISIEEGRGGYVRTIYREFQISILQAVEDYGLENVSEGTRKKYEEGNTTERIKFLHVIAPRTKKELGAKGNKAMNFLSKTIEIQAKQLVRDSGYDEMPVAIARFFKRRNEVYGRSPGMDAMPDILELNQTKKARITAIEKSLDPPLGVYDDSVLGNEEIDTSAGGINVFASSGRIANRDPIFPLFTVETIREVDKSVEDLVKSINEHFNIDRLLDFNNQTAMTLGEANLRNKIRSEALTSLFSRQIAELFTPIVERSVSILFRKGRLGVIRGSKEDFELTSKGEIPEIIPKFIEEYILSGKEFYEVEYLTPAARMMQTFEAEGVMRAWEFAGMVAQFNPDVLDGLDADESLKVVGYAMGAPSSVFKSEELMAQIRAAKQQAAQSQMAREEVGADNEIIRQIGATEEQVNLAALAKQEAEAAEAEAPAVF